MVARMNPLPAIYLRISSDRAGDELGVTRQREDCLQLCEARGFANPMIFVDNDVSASKAGRRRGFRELMAAVEDGQIDVIVTHMTVGSFGTVLNACARTSYSNGSRFA